MQTEPEVLSCTVRPAELPRHENLVDENRLEKREADLARKIAGRPGALQVTADALRPKRF